MSSTHSTRSPESAASTTTDRSVAVAAAIDTALVVSFVAIGRRNHDRDETISGLVETAAPFVIALGAAWLIWRVWAQPMSVRSGVSVWVTTLVLGMVLRRFVFDDGTATSFVVVAAAFLSLLIVWRLVAAWFVARRSPRI